MKRTLNRLDSIHRHLYDAVEAIDPRLYSKRPAEKEWSVAEVMHHLCLVEERVLAALEQSVKEPAAKIGILRRLIPTRIVSWRLIRVEAPKSVRPGKELARDQSLRSYNEVRAKLKGFCAQHGAQRLRKISFQHPALGIIDGVAAVSFVGFHEQRHHKQIREIVKKLGQ
jgi:DinB superfamily